MKGNRPQLETVPETEVLFDLNGCEVDPDSPEGDLCPPIQSKAERNSALLNDLFAYKKQLLTTEKKLKVIEGKRDREMKYIVSKLLLLEGQLLKDKKKVQRVLREKDRMIEHLQFLLAESTTNATDFIDGRRPGNAATPVNFERREQPQFSRQQRDFKSYSLPASCDAECQTEDPDVFFTSDEEPQVWLELPGKTQPREHRSYSNPDDPDEAYEKTSDTKLKEKDMVVVSHESAAGAPNQRRDSTSVIAMRRKKSLSSPDLQQLLLASLKDGSSTDELPDELNNDNQEEEYVNMEDKTRNLHSPGYFDEVGMSIAANLASPRPSLPNITIPNMFGLFAAGQKPSASSELSSEASSSANSSTETFSQSYKDSYLDPAYAPYINESLEEEETKSTQDEGNENRPKQRVRKQAALLIKPMVYLRSYSTPDASFEAGNALQSMFNVTESDRGAPIPSAQIHYSGTPKDTLRTEDDAKYEKLSKESTDASEKTKKHAKK